MLVYQRVYLVGAQRGSVSNLINIPTLENDSCYGKRNSGVPIPKCSIYKIFTYIWLKFYGTIPHMQHRWDFLQQNNLRLAALEIRKLLYSHNKQLPQTKTRRTQKFRCLTTLFHIGGAERFGARDEGNFPPKCGAKESEASNPRSKHMTLF